MSTTSSNPIILITGANRGIGFSIIQTTALRFPTATYLLGSRSAASGEEAISKLKSLGVTAALMVLELDITNDSSILSAVSTVKEKFGRLDVLVNNAGIAEIYNEGEPLEKLRSSFNNTLNTNVTSVAAITSAFLPLLHSTNPNNTPSRIINISSARASLTNSLNGKMPPTKIVSYSVSKAALNSLTIEMAKSEGQGGCEVFCAGPGFCKTGFNGFTGVRDPVEGAEVVVRLIVAERGVFSSGSFWEFEGGVMREVPW